MADLVRALLRDQFEAPGVTIRVLAPAAQFYVTGTVQAPNTIADIQPYSLWLAPDRTLVVYENQRGTPQGAFVSDVTDGLTMIELVGARAGEIVAMSTTLDPTSTILAPGRCVQTLFGGVKIVLYAYGNGFRLHAERSFAAFLLAWLRQAASAIGDSDP
jgi:heterotetrameric sarcosine oxidase gamma subunit